MDNGDSSTPNYVDTLARTIWGEARGNGVLGMYAVACVIKNRLALDTWFGGTWEEVCKKPFQFSCWNENDPNYKKLLAVSIPDELAIATVDELAFVKANEIASTFVNGYGIDICSGATHYYDNSIKLPVSWTATWKPLGSFGGFNFGLVS